MKTDDLKAQGLNEEQITFIMAENGKDVNKVKAERDTYKENYDTAQTTLKGFDGIDVGKLQGEVKKLTEDLTKKDTDYQAKLAETEFNTKLDKTIGEYGARNAKTVMALLDINSLKSSKNQDSDIKSALEASKKENSYLFQDTLVPRVVSTTPGLNTNVDDKKTQANEAFRSLFGKE